MVDFDFWQRRYQITYYDVSTCLATLGGLKAVIDPLIGLILPLLALSFFYKMSIIIQENYERRTKHEFARFLDKTVQVLAEAIQMIQAREKKKETILNKNLLQDGLKQWDAQ